jgi:TM2 domain-containing membrane protein YozV
MSGEDSVPAVSAPPALPKPPPHPLDQEWFIYIDGENYGPYSGHLMKDYIAEGRIGPETHVCAAGSTDWREVAATAPFGALFPKKAFVAATPRGTTQTFVSNSAGAPLVQINQTFAPSPLATGGPARPKNPAIALVLSFFIPGVGQFYNGQIGKGIVMLAACAALWIVLLGWIISIWSMIDAYQSAKSISLRYNERTGQGWPTSPS